MQAFGEYMNDETASAMKARDYKDATDLVASPVVIDRAAFNQGQNAQYRPHIEHSETMDSLVARGPHAVLYENHPNDSRVTGPHEVAPSCVSRFGTGGGNVPLVQAFPIDTQNMTEGHASGGKGFGEQGDPSFTITKGHSHAVAFQESELRLNGKITEQAVCPTLKAGTKSGDTEPKVIAFEPGISKREGKDARFVEEMSPTLRKEMGDNQVAVASRMAVRRLTPRECERLQGFPDDHTLIPWRGKPAEQCPDGPRYKALGNSMAVPCMAWIGKRIAKVVALSTTNKEEKK